ncbi:hypothetical protein EIP91_001960 [Steccherinum ochraceum]|uniref:F-box domain-containing protein n=1 Tax=Steccherinum ochraceum TaxID=92696 RepID=A0A4R0RQ80_9APHY|nr:hypothetical protein EIP91_001960 [Steccherinum ochraceum]
MQESPPRFWPPEILDMFFGYLELTESVQECALVCRGWRPHAQRVLFKSYHRYLESHAMDPRDRRLTSLTIFLGTEPHIALYITSLYLSSSPDDTLRAVISVGANSLFASLMAALPQLRHLTLNNVAMIVSIGQVPAEKPFDRLPSLETLTLRRVSGKQGMLSRLLDIRPLNGTLSLHCRRGLNLGSEDIERCLQVKHLKLCGSLVRFPTRITGASTPTTRYLTLALTEVVDLQYRRDVNRQNAHFDSSSKAHRGGMDWFLRQCGEVLDCFELDVSGTTWIDQYDIADSKWTLFHLEEICPSLLSLRLSFRIDIHQRAGSSPRLAWATELAQTVDLVARVLSSAPKTVTEIVFSISVKHWKSQRVDERTDAHDHPGVDTRHCWEPLIKAMDLGVFRDLGSVQFRLHKKLDRAGTMLFPAIAAQPRINLGSIGESIATQFGELVRRGILHVWSGNHHAITIYHETVDYSNKTTVPQRSFPDELVEDILIRAWLDTDWSSPKQRWFLYCKILGLSRQWRRIMQDVAIHYRLFESLADFQAYTLLASSSDSAFPPAKYLRIPYSDLSTSYLDAFDMTPLVQSCSEVDVIPMFDGRLWELCNLINRGGPQPQLQSLAFAFENYAVFNFLHQHRWAEVVQASPRMSSVTTLSITCTNPRETGWVYRDILDFKCMLLPFPNLVHLRTNVPISLLLVSKHLKALVTLTLDIPPLYLKNFHATSILSWGVISALKTQAFVPKKITVESGSLKPIGWDQLCTLCDALGVETVFIPKYAPTYEAPMPVRSAKEALRYLEAASVRFSKLPMGDKTAVTECIDRYIDRYHAHPMSDRELSLSGRTMFGVVIRY